MISTTLVLISNGVQNFLSLNPIIFVILFIITLPFTFASIAPMLTFFNSIAYFYFYYIWNFKNRNEPDFWEKPKLNLAKYLSSLFKLWHDYEIIGFDNIPDSGPALVISYHGLAPIDTMYLISEIKLRKNRHMGSVVHRFMQNVPGAKPVMDILKLAPGTRESCVETLKNGELLSILPGGDFEAVAGDENYEVLLDKRTGFAKVALEAKVPIIPVFTQNIREAYRIPHFGKNFFFKLFKITGFPLMPMYGGFPVKLRTIIGEPIPYDPAFTPEVLARKTADAIREMIKKHQEIPGSIGNALLQRFQQKPKKS